jgi:hypothetical protein
MRSTLANPLRSGRTPPLPRWLALTALLLPACGTAPPPAPAPVAGPAPEQVSPPPVELSPVPEPPSLVVSGRLAKLSASLATAHAWTQLPIPQSEQVTEILTGEAVGPLVDLDQPIDFAVGVTGSGARMKDLTALSAAVNDPDRVKAALAERYKLVPGDDGTLLIQGLGRPAHKADDDSDDDKASSDDRETTRTCELSPAFGAAPVRLVCALSPKALAELGPWLVRTATRGSTTADLHVDVRMKPLQPTITEQKRLIGMILGSVLGGRIGLSSLRDLAVALGSDLADFASDLDGAAADVTLGEHGVQATFTLRLSGSSSTLGRIATAHPERSGPAPAAFWQLPGDADLALFHRGVDEAQLAQERDLVLRAVGDTLGESGVKEPDRKAIVDALGKLVSAAAGVYASGIDAEGVGKALSAEKALTVKDEQSEKDEAKRQAVEELLGWRVMEMDEPSTRFASGLKELSVAIAKPSVAAAYREKVADAVPLALRSLAAAKSAGLPAGAQHYILELRTFERKASPPPSLVGGRRPAAPRKPRPPLKPLLVHLFLVPDGPRTWLAVGGDEAVTAARLVATLASSGNNLAGQAALAPLKDGAGAVGAGGFITPRSLPEMAQQVALLFNGTTWGAKETFEEAAQMPHRGLTPIVFSSTAQPGRAPAVTVSNVSIPRQAIEDVVTAILRHGGF